MHVTSLRLTEYRNTAWLTHVLQALPLEAPEISNEGPSGFPQRQMEVEQWGADGTWPVSCRVALER